MKTCSHFNCLLPDVTCDALALSLHQLAESLGNAVDAKAPCTCAHSEEVAVISQILALSMGFNPREADLLHVAGHLHDIGKIGIPDTILLKPGPLTPHEFAVIKQHPQIGAAIVRPVKAFAAPGGVADCILHHHERYDGSGYPFGIAGRRIPTGARIIAVADSLSAMLQPRPYKKSMSYEDAVQELFDLSGKSYDPRVIKALADSKEMVHDALTACPSHTPQQEAHHEPEQIQHHIGAVCKTFPQTRPEPHGACQKRA